MGLFVLEHKEQLHEFDVKSTAEMEKFIRALEKIMVNYKPNSDYLQFHTACHNLTVDGVVDYIEIRGGDLDFEAVPVRVWTET